MIMILVSKCTFSWVRNTIMLSKIVSDEFLLHKVTYLSYGFSYVDPVTYMPDTTLDPAAMIKHSMNVLYLATEFLTPGHRVLHFYAPLYAHRLTVRAS